jgi:hypothetical protein
MVDIGQKEEFRAVPILADSNFRQYDAADRRVGRGWSLCMLLAYEFYTIQSTRFIEYMILSIFCVSSLCVNHSFIVADLVTCTRLGGCGLGAPLYFVSSWACFILLPTLDLMS